MCAPLYASGVLWTLVYDTAYAHQDKRDDVLVGIKSTALLFGDHTKPVLYAFLVASSVFAGLAGWENGNGLPFFSSLLVGTALLGTKLRTIGYVSLAISGPVLKVRSFNIPAQGGLYFRYCAYFGWFVFAGALLDYILAQSSREPRTRASSKRLSN